MPEAVVFVHDETIQPGCVLIQAVLGGDRHLLYEFFDDTDWCVDSIDHMKPVPASLLDRAASLRAEVRTRGDNR